jgi:hypothetical protein
VGLEGKSIGMLISYSFSATIPVAVLAAVGDTVPLFNAVLRITVPLVSDTAPMLIVVVEASVIIAPIDTEPDVLEPDLFDTVCSADA